MDDVVCILPCGFPTTYKILKNHQDGEKCWACMSHELKIDDCLKMPFNQMSLKRKQFDTDIEIFTKRKKYFVSTEPDKFIDENIKKLKNDLDTRRDELKSSLIKKIDDQYLNLWLKIQEDFATKKSEFNQKKKLLEDFDINFKNNHNINSLNCEAQINYLKESIQKIHENIGIIEKSISSIKNHTVNFVSNENNFDTKLIFGKIKKTVTFRLLIEKFSMCMKMGHKVINQFPTIVQNSEWKIRAIREEKNGIEYLGVYVQCNPQYMSNSWPIKAKGELRLLHRTHADRNICKKLEFVFNQNIRSCGFNDFISLKCLLDAKNGFYDTQLDRIRLEAYIDADEPKEEFKNYYDLLTERKIKELRTDNGKENLSNDLKKYIKDAGIKHNTSVEYCPQMNGKAERLNRTLIEKARCMLIASNTSLSFWSAAVDTANYIRNRSKSAALNGKTPYGFFFGKLPNLSHLKIFGCDAYPLIVNKVGKKFEPKNHKAFRSRDIRFNENRILDNENQETNELTLSRSIGSDQIKDEINENDNEHNEETGNGSDREDQENNKLNKD
ncbi:unnamed protein product [Brachionus calyciflorus]|uniref:Integrase catalytic domain-containing protein n=1 Tax=Brachionus calyciflorus TaxID=104777 RepID=A0A813W6E9_9BILA|nr:unnamed protein product [Brachionus calyciflorus]